MALIRNAVEQSTSSRRHQDLFETGGDESHYFQNSTGISIICKACTLECRLGECKDPRSIAMGVPCQKQLLTITPRENVKEIPPQAASPSLMILLCRVRRDDGSCRIEGFVKTNAYSYLLLPRLKTITARVLVHQQIQCHSV
jgi:hypothetical protein